ncbi:MAG: hypothetical protein ACYTX0_26605, partial [Nostoc sp.]
WERGANSLVPRIPTWEKGLGDEGKTSSQSNFFLKLTRMSFFCAPTTDVVQIHENCCKCQNIHGCCIKTRP